ncbi:MAG: polysaccharide pyruvyl transferase family protein [Betaproteobacteria bacterium]|nr:polysaccharide pyruvyl transferase family protein [Betaproteobacteria bacterium]
MKVGIVTLYNAFNYGAYLQAFATSTLLKEWGHTPVVSSLEDARGLYLRYRTLVSKRPSTLVFNARKYFAFRTGWSAFQRVSATHLKSCDAIVIGSDEMWNVRNPTFRSRPEYFGFGFEHVPTIANAVSASESTAADLANNDKIRLGLARLTSVSVRDRHTQSLYTALTGKDAPIVLDPTFLVDFRGLSTPRGEGALCLGLYVCFRASEAAGGHEVCKEGRGSGHFGGIQQFLVRRKHSRDPNGILGILADGHLGGDRYISRNNFLHTV